MFGRKEKLPTYHARLLRPERLPDGSELHAACFEELPGCIAQGPTASAAQVALWRILPAYLEELRRHRQPAPPVNRAGGVGILGVTILFGPVGAEETQIRAPAPPITEAPEPNLVPVEVDRTAALTAA